MAMESILLASGSPRRAELLASVGIAFEVHAADLDERARDAIPPAERVVALARDKALAAAKAAAPHAPRLVLAADTLVCVPEDAADGSSGAGRQRVLGSELPLGPEQALGKPIDRGDAERMMRLLSGRDHYVRTGVALYDRLACKMRTIRSDSLVGFAPMSEEELASYLDSGEWRGVAGAYRIQGLASLYINALEGSWSGVVGLPMRELYVILRDADYRNPSLTG